MEPLETMGDAEAGQLELHCPVCERVVRRADTTPCAVCKRRVCFACVRPYGHHMRACEECRMADW